MKISSIAFVAVCTTAVLAMDLSRYLHGTCFAGNQTCVIEGLEGHTRPIICNPRHACMNDGDSCRAKAKHVTKSSEAPYTKKVKCDGHGHKGKKTKSAPVSGSSKTAWESYVTGTPLMGTGARPTGKGDLVVTQVTRVTSVKGGEGMPTWAATWEA